MSTALDDPIERRHRGPALVLVESTDTGDRVLAQINCREGREGCFELVSLKIGGEHQAMWRSMLQVAVEATSTMEEVR